MNNNDAILSFLGPARVQGGQWYDQGSVPASSLARSETVLCKLVLAPVGTLGDATSELQWTKPSSGRATENVVIWSCAVTDADNQAGTDTLLTSNYVPKAVAVAQRQQDALREIYGIPGGAMGLIPAHQHGPLAEPIFSVHSATAALFLNPAWISFMGALREGDLLNGTVELPRALAPAGNQAWFALPPAHVLALHLPRFEQWSQEPGTPHPIALRAPDGHVVCYLVCESELRQLHAQVVQNWMSLVDYFSLPSLSFAVEPKQRGAPLAGPVTIKAKLCYVAWERAPDTRVAPVVPDELRQMIYPTPV